VFAIKAIHKQKLMTKSSYHHKQMVKEIQFQRKMRDCGNVLKLYKVYESDQYIYLVMEYLDGGTLGELLEK
jgi:serine/threonine protein kinase